SGGGTARAAAQNRGGGTAAAEKPPPKQPGDDSARSSGVRNQAWRCEVDHVYSASHILGGVGMNRGHFVICRCVFVAFFLCAGRAFADPLQWQLSDGGNGHYYEFVRATFINYDQAKAQAAAKSFAGLPGHLATITSAPEGDFI